MICKFIGKDGSMNLKNGENYAINSWIGEFHNGEEIISVIWIKVERPNYQPIPYQSAYKLLENWQLVEIQ